MASRGRPSKRGTPFDRLIKQQCQKGRFGVGVNKSAGMVHGKWGATSFTSLRTVNGTGSTKDHSLYQQSSAISDSGIGVSRKRDWPSAEPTLPVDNSAALFTAPRRKKFFKSRDTDSQQQEKTNESNIENINETKISKSIRSQPAIVNNNVEGDDFTQPSGDMNTIEDTQSNALSQPSDSELLNEDRQNIPQILSKQSKETRRGGRRPISSLRPDKTEGSKRSKNGMDENTTSRQIDVPDVAGGARNHRKILQPTTALPEDTLAPQITSISSSNSSTRSTRSSRLRGANHVAVNYDEEKSNEYLDEVCEARGAPKSSSRLNKNGDAVNLTDTKEENFQEPENSVTIHTIPLKSKLIENNPSSVMQTKQTCEQIGTDIKMKDKDWTMEDVDQFYNKVSKDVIKEPQFTETNVQQSNVNDNESSDKVDFNTYTRKRRQKLVENVERKKDTATADDCQSNMLHGQCSVDKNLDERVPNQQGITKMASTTSNINNIASKMDEIENISKQEPSTLPNAFNESSLSPKTSKDFSIKVLADLKEEEEVAPIHETDNKGDKFNSKNLERNDILSLNQPIEKSGHKLENIEEDSDFYSKLMEIKSQVNPNAPVKSFSLLSKQSSSISSTGTAAGSTTVVKKRSIFKSKAQSNVNSIGGNGNTNQVAGQGSKGRSLYKHKFGANNDDAPKEEPSFRSQVLQRALTMPSTSETSLEFDDCEFNDPATSAADMSFSSKRLVRVPTVTGGSGSSSLSGFDETLKEVVSVKCPKEQKTYYQVIKKTKNAHQIQDTGEFQEFNDDVEYIQEGLGSHNNLSTRCLSTLTLASKCMEPPFRMHLRAHGTVTKFFSELKDAPKNPSLALCTSTVLFVLSQDRLNMDLDRESLELMLNLLDTDSRIKDALDGAGLSKRELEKNKSKVQELVAAMKAKGRAVNLSLDHISADHLAMETLLSMTSKRAGEWFKEELRELGGLDHLVHTMTDCLAFLTADEISMWTEPLHNKLKKSDRVLKVLESVTHENEENCQYLLEYKSGKFIDTIHSFYKLLDEEVPLNSKITGNNVTDKEDKDSVAYTLRESLLGVIRVYINLVHDYKSVPHGSFLSGEKEGMFDMCLHGMFVSPDYLPQDKRFDLIVLTLTLIINLVENCKPNRIILMKTLIPQKSDDMFTSQDQKLAPEGLIQMFLEREENAKRLETKTDKILDGKGDDDDVGSTKKENSQISQVESEDVTDTKPDPEKKAPDAHASYGSKTKKDAARNPPNNKAASSANSNPQKSHEEFVDETVKKLLEKAGSHMEDTLIASYLTLIIGYLIHENSEHEKIVRQWMPENNFAHMVAVLKKFYNFMMLTASASVTSTRGLKATEMILKYLEKLDQEPEETKSQELKNNRSSIDMQEETFNDLTIFDVTKDEDEDLDDVSHAGSRSDRSRNSESSILDMKSPNFDDFGKL